MTAGWLRRVAMVTALALVVLLDLSSCGGGGTPTTSQHKQDGREVAQAEDGLEKVADAETCAEDAEPVDPPYGDGFPTDWPFPPGTVVYDVEDRGDAGTVVSAISTEAFSGVLDFMNTDVVHAGFRIESGETEEHDAEAEWRGGDFHGRWAIRASATCPGESTIQVLAAPL
jgi:hypothetical protein